MSPRVRRFHRRPVRLALAAAAAAAALLAPAPASAARESDDARCYAEAPGVGVDGTARPAKLRMALIRVVLEDADGRPADGMVEVDGLAIGPTGRALRIPVCAHRMRVLAGERSAEQWLSLSSSDFTTLKVRLAAAAGARATSAPPPAQAAPTAAAPLPSATSPNDKRMAVIHYHRRDGRYEGWGLHTWQGNGEGPDALLPGVSWGTPLEPVGRDEFGVFFLVPAKFYADGRVNYILHTDTRKDCDVDSSFLLRESREAWVVEGRCEPYLSKKKAMEALHR